MISRQPFSPRSLLALVAASAALVVLAPNGATAVAAETVRAGSNVNNGNSGNNGNSNHRSRLLQQDHPYTYSSPNVRARAAAISKDYQIMSSLLALDTAEGHQQAEKVYRLGAYCQSYASLTLDNPLANGIVQGTEVTGTSSTGDEVKGVLHSDGLPGDATISVQYLIPPEGINAICSVSGNPDPKKDKCFATNGSISVSGGANLGYKGYNADSDTANGQSLHSISDDINGFATQGYPRIGTFAEYYGSNKYADKFMQAAFAKNDTELTSGDGNAQFSKFPNFGTNEFIRVATLTMNSWMHVVIKMRDAVENCKTDTNAGKTITEVPLWDNAVATYRGLGGAADGSMGQLYHLANEYCQLFGTCISGPGNTQGTAQANQKVYTYFNSGKQDLLDGNCDSAETALEQAAVYMLVPLIQGTLYHAYELDLVKQQREIEQGKAAAFLHSILPLVHNCNAGNGDMLYAQLQVGKAKEASFEVTKQSLETQYGCLGLTCEDIGGIVDTSNKSTYVKNAFPCNAVSIGDQNGDGIPDVPAPAPVVPPVIPAPTPVVPAPAPIAPPIFDDDMPTSSPTDPPTTEDEFYRYADANDDGVTYALAIGLPLLSVFAIAVVVIRSYKKKQPAKEFDTAETGGEVPEEGPGDEKVENLQAEML